MTVKALEVILNGNKLFTVGMADWRMMGATVMCHRQTLEDMKRLEGIPDVPLPDHAPQEFERCHLQAYVGVPDPDRPGSSSGQSYDNQELTLGDGNHYQIDRNKRT